MALEAEDVKTDLTAHEQKCDERQKNIYAKIDAVSAEVHSLGKYVYTGLGIVIAFQCFFTWHLMSS